MKSGNNLIGKNKFYFLLHPVGYYLKTSFLKDFEAVKNWDDNFLFSGILENSKTIHYRIGQSWFKKKLSRLHIAQPEEKNGWYDVETLDDKNSGHIREIKIGGSKPQTIESL